MNSRVLRNGVVICVCQECRANNLEALKPALEDESRSPCFKVDLCEDPESLTHIIRENGLQSLVVAACSNPEHIRSFNSACKHAGLNPLTVEYLYQNLLNAGPSHSRLTDVAKLTLIVTIAKASTALLAKRAIKRFVGPSSKLSRREFLHSFKDMFLKYSEIPLLDEEVCSRYSKACRYCIDICEYNAISKVDGTVSINTSLCVECGACASACPVGALQIPTLSDLQVAEIAKAASLSEIKGEKRVLMATCDKGMALLAARAGEEEFSNPGFIMVRVPCVAGLSWAHLIMLVASGLSLVMLCPDDSCERVRGLTYTREAVRSTNDMIEGLGLNDYALIELVEEGSDQSTNTLMLLYEQVPPFTPREAPIGGGVRRALLRSALNLIASYKGSLYEGGFRGEALQFFDISIDDNRCTLCPACTYVCPDGAIGLKEEEGEDIILFNPSRCVGCRICTYSCPEGALTLRKELRPAGVIKDAWLTRARAEIVRCRSCGNRVASSKALERVMHTLQAEGFKEILDTMLLCQECKQSIGARNAPDEG